KVAERCHHDIGAIIQRPANCRLLTGPQGLRPRVARTHDDTAAALQVCRLYRRAVEVDDADHELVAGTDAVVCVPRVDVVTLQRVLPIGDAADPGTCAALDGGLEGELVALG